MAVDVAEVMSHALVEGKQCCEVRLQRWVGQVVPGLTACVKDFGPVCRCPHGIQVCFQVLNTKRLTMHILFVFNI